MNSIDVSVSPPGYSESPVGTLEPMSGLDVGLLFISGLEELSVGFGGFAVGFVGFAVGFWGFSVVLGGFAVGFGGFAVGFGGFAVGFGGFAVGLFVGWEVVTEP